MRELQFSLYEVFGYLLPGAVLTGGVALVFWAVFLPQTAIDFDIKSVEVWGTFLALAYVAGHVGQGIGNAIIRQFVSAEEHAINTVLEPAIVDACKAKVKELTGADVATMKPRWLYGICDDAVIRSGKIGERDVYIYREGFYRGTLVGTLFLIVGFALLAVRLLSLNDNPEVQRVPFLALLAVWCVILATVNTFVIGAIWERGKGKLLYTFVALGAVLLVVGVWCVWFGNWSATASLGNLQLTPGRLLFLAGLGVVGAWFLWHRYWRFAEYRVTHAMLGFLTIKDDKKSDAPKGTPPTT